MKKSAWITGTIIVMVLAAAIGIYYRYSAQQKSDLINNCTASGGSFKLATGICECTASGYSLKQGKCVDAAGLPGGRLKEATDLPVR
ncbi:hypothetical protein HZA42_00535 [Candidatus Peregrinibacteria bacterium]|nr:hypothetical protein [Candidatus Peregrinibacteria bacterium]